MSVNKVNQSTGELSPIAGGTLYADAPVGSIQAYGGSSAPWGWLLCQGQAISRTTYAELFNVIGTSFGEGDGSTTFNIPDMRESVPKGAGLSGKSSTHYDADGVALGEFIEDRIKAHNHNIRDNTGRIVASVYGTTGGASAYTPSRSSSISDDSIVTLDTGSTTNEVKSVGVNYIIKATTISLPNDFTKLEAASSIFSSTAVSKSLGSDIVVALIM